MSVWSKEAHRMSASLADSAARLPAWRTDAGWAACSPSQAGSLTSNSSALVVNRFAQEVNRFGAHGR
ncbi:MAG: hypothetical protein DME60_07335 [Verrucomicrobia bacterium]|nr:MAG: hypothetical protein DME60_07335 [Verrucomicrobiota bacterium]